MRAFIVLSACLLLAACGAHGPFRDRGSDYLDAEPVAPLVYPEGIPVIPAREAWPIPAVEQRRRRVEGEDAKTIVPEPPRIVEDAAALPGDSGAGQPVPASRVLLAEDGNGFPVLMLDLDFDWAWQGVGDALRALDDVRIEDLDRDQAIYFVVPARQRTDSGDPYRLKLNYTANGIQVALQVDEDAMAPREIALPLLERLRAGLLK